MTFLWFWLHYRALEEISRKLPQAREELESAQEELIEVRREETSAASELNRRRTNLEERRVAMNANKSHSRVLDFLLTQKQEGQIPGIYGRLVSTSVLIVSRPINLLLYQEVNQNKLFQKITSKFPQYWPLYLEPYRFLYDL